MPERTDVVVVGGGIAGSSAAYHLAEAGVAVILLERGRIGSGATAAAVGVLSPPVRQPFHETVHDRGLDVARTIWAFAQRSVEGLGALLQREGAADAAELDLSGGHVLAERHTEREMRRSWEGLTEAGFAGRWIEAGDVADLTGGGRGFTGGYVLEGGGSFAPGPATAALARAARARGATVLEEVPVDQVDREEGGLWCRTPRGAIRCERVIYATHVDTRRFTALLGEEIVPIRGQGLAAIAPPGLRVPGSFSTHWKLNVWRSSPAGRLLMGGWRHDAWDRAYWKTRPELDTHLQRDLQQWFESAFPATAPLRVEHRWSGIFGWTADYLPLVGPLPGTPDELVVSGFSGGGLPFAFESGRVIAHAVRDVDPVPGAELLDPRRFI